MSDKRDDGGRAFPKDGAAYSEGMSLRDYHAAAALPFAFQAWEEGYFDINKDADNPLTLIAECAYQFADAMLAARTK